MCSLCCSSLQTLGSTRRDPKTQIRFIHTQPPKLKVLLSRQLEINSFGLGRLFYKSSHQLRYGDQNGRNLEGWYTA